MGLFSKKEEVVKSKSKLLEDFITKSTGLTRILEKETEYFKDIKIKQAEMLLESKLNLIDELEEIKANLTLNPQYLQNLPEAEKKKIVAANANLIKAAEDNYNETLKAKEVNKLILEAISEAVANSRVIDGAYGDKGSAYRSGYENSPITLIQNA
jgi:hypothetical protein